MPKKLQTNPKAQEARERKEEQKKAVKQAKTKAEEDAKWVDEGTTAAEQRKKAAEATKALEAAKRAAKKALLEKEAAELEKVKPKGKNEKITQIQILSVHEKQKQERERQRFEEEREAARLLTMQPLVPNYNQLSKQQRIADEERYGHNNIIEAQTLDDAISQLKILEGDSVDVDRHPEKRLKAAFRAYEEQQMPLLKEEYKGLKFTQLKQKLWEQWQKAPENPLVMARMNAANTVLSTPATPASP